VTVDGDFGVQTEDSTKAWQKTRGLAVDGVVGPETLRAAVLPSPALVVAAPAPAPVAAPAPAPAIAGSPATIKEGSSGVDVRAWQYVLESQRLIAYTDIDGAFGAKTKAATIVFQKSLGLTADGIVGPGTWKAANNIASVSGDFAFDSPLPGVVPLAAPRLVDVSADRSLAARLALHLLRSEQGTESKPLVEQFQRLIGLNPTGNYGPGTARALMRYGHVPVNPYYWPSQGSGREKAEYRSALYREAARDPQRAVEWNAAASRV
jgi:peptidoglycan hydrolase-like protein with peptidoglycan-binding domain